MSRFILPIGLTLVMAGCTAASPDLSGDALSSDTEEGETGPDGTDGDGTDGDGADGDGDDTVDDGPADADADGYTEDEDCDDGDADIHPDAEELDDGIDNDCNGYADDVSVCTDSLADYESIQDASDSVPDDWTVLVCAGEYEENIRFNGKTTAVIGVDGAESTIVRPANDQSPVVAFSDADDSKLAGFTVTGGRAENGAGILVQGCEITLEDNIIVVNQATNNGGGMAGDPGRHAADLPGAGRPLRGRCAGRVLLRLGPRTLCERQRAQPAACPRAVAPGP